MQQDKSHEKIVGRIHGKPVAKHTRLTSIMVADVETVSPDTPLGQIHALFSERALHHLPVVAGDRLVGLISYTDLVRVDSDPNRPAQPWLRESKLLAQHVMQPRATLVTAGAQLTVRDAAAMLCEGTFHSLPVVDAEDRLLGIVTSTDLIGCLVELLE